jgi:hypothetical protein
MSWPVALLVCFGVYYVVALLTGSMWIGLAIAACAFWDLSRERGDSDDQAPQAEQHDDEADADYKPWRL